jgi:hypothetical protein
MHRRTRAIAVTLTAALLAVGLVTMANADSGHGRPSCTAPPMDETSHGSRDGFDHTHVSNPAVFASLAELEGFINACRTNDNPIIEGASASARAVRVSGVNRVQLRALLQQYVADADPVTAGAQPGWVTRSASESVNTGDNRTLTVTTPFHTVNQATTPLTQGWTRAVIRALVRYSNGQLVFYVVPTYPIWVDDGPVTALPA